MPRYDAIQNAFNVGETSLRGRTDLDLYKKALAYDENWQPKPQGPILMRAGSEKIARVADQTARRGFTFRAKDDAQYDVVLGERTISIFNAGGSEEATATKVKGIELSTGLFSGAEIIAHGPNQYYPSYSAGGNYWGLGAGSRMRWYVMIPSPGAYDIVSGVVGMADVRIRYGTAPGGSEILDAILFANGTFDLPQGGLYIDVECRSGAASWYPPSVRAVESAIPLASPWSAAQLDLVQRVEVPGEDRVLFFHPNVQPHELKRVAANDWTFTPIDFDAKPEEWTNLTWPGVAEIYLGRLIVAIENRIWGSRAGELFDFRLATGEGGTPVAADGFDIKAATKGTIRWLREGPRTLLAGTDIGLVSVGSSTGLLAPGDIQCREENTHAAAAIPAAKAGTLLLYVTADRRKVRAVDYDNRNEGYVAKDILFVAEHMTKGGVADIQVAPDSGLIVLRLETGELRICSFDSEQGITGWWRAPITAAAVISAAMLRGLAGEYVWLLTQRDAGVHLERMPLFDAEGVRYLDASVERTSTEGQSDITGLDHLAGKTARVLIGGALAGDFPVTAAGRLVLPEALAAGLSIVVGLPYRATAKLLKLEGGNPAGTAQAATVAWASVAVRLTDSALPKINGKRPSDRRTASPTEAVEPLFTGDVSVIGVNGDIVIEQDLPFRTEVCAVFGTASLGKV